MKSNEERFWQKVNKFGPVPNYQPSLGNCWLWTGATNPKGYGTFTVFAKFNGYTWKRTASVHRFAYELAHSPIPGDLVIDHLCRNRACLRDSHIEAVTLQTNIRRGLRWANPLSNNTCSKGHPRTPEGTYTWTSPTGRTFHQCRECVRINQRARYQAKKPPN